MSEINWYALNELPQAQEWQSLLNTDIDDTCYCYLLIDQCRLDQCMRKVFMACDLPEYEYLYLKTDSQHLLEVSPVLIECTHEPWLYAEVIAELRAERAGLIIESHLPHQQLADHLRRYLVVPDDGGESYLRFYDPAVWLALLLLQQHNLIKADVITQVIFPHWLKTETALWVSDQSESVNSGHQPKELTSGKNLNTGDEFDDIAIRTRLLYWVGQHETLQGQDWMMNEFQELFDVLLKLVARDVTDIWELEFWLPILVSAPECLGAAWLTEYLATCDVSFLGRERLQELLTERQYADEM